ncbi:receptor-like protein kinase 5 [Phtheirospermum japonicum]|uniref:Receptor-like protein kinase 5 n=1 Tax=Phtheirospermum japonicum TaxID=374723 RepID=A0A830CQC9_9LAMI|nr:receptor-like protein kinase 5 [Phtheirospermum japonicum]
MVPFILFILLIPPCIQVNSQSSLLSSSQQTILLSFKQHWNNPPSLDSWTPNSSLSDWAPEVEYNATSGSITGLYLSGKQITGTIPSTICQLKDLTSIDLSENNISGYIPTSLYNCSNLQRLDLSSNALSGTIPGEFYLMNKLRRLFLHQNSLSGTIPTRLFQMTGLQSLSLGYNNLSGQIPKQLDFLGLQVLNLTHNRLDGTIPESIGMIAKLSALDLSNNELSGDIIESIFRLKPMGTFRLCSNKFSGRIPYEFVNKRFYDNCLDFFNICSDKGNESLPNCPSRLCSDSRINGYLECNNGNNSSNSSSSSSKSSKRNNEPKKYVIFVVGVGCGILGFALFFYMARNKCWVNMREMIGSRLKKVAKEEDKWKMISFQKLKFDKTEILTNLTDENVIGNGGSGKVYRVFINKIGKAVAVKSISNSRKSDTRLQKEFAAEIRTLGTIRHFNIVKLLCYISGDDMKLLVYQYFENKSLDQWLHGDGSAIKLDWPMRLNIAVGAAQGLYYMHHDCSPPIIHRDIKTSNILLDSEFNAKIADFGLAKLLSGNGGNTETASAVAGTFGYIAPEYAYTSKVNTKSDIYSFGVVLLELATGRKAVTHGDHLNLAGWAQLQCKNTSAVFDALDGEIKEPIYLDQMMAVFRLGVSCTATSPSDRPTMKGCLRTLLNCSNNSSSSSSSQSNTFSSSSQSNTFSPISQSNEFTTP